MNASEAVMVLTAAATVDKRTIGEADARMWAEILPPSVGPRLAVEAVKAYYAERREMIMPADVIAYIPKARRRVGNPCDEFTEHLRELAGKPTREKYFREYFELRATGLDGPTAADRAAKLIGVAGQLEGDAA